MLSQTTVTAIRALVYIAGERGAHPVPPTEVADALAGSPAYLGKIHTQLVKAGLLRAHRGVKGGVTLDRAASSITLLEIVEACQGRILGDYCEPQDDREAVCAFHRAMQEVQEGLLETLGRWTLADLLAKPQPSPALRDRVSCRMAVRVPESLSDAEAAQ